jgi:hypothetical protein
VTSFLPLSLSCLFEPKRCPVNSLKFIENKNKKIISFLFLICLNRGNLSKLHQSVFIFDKLNLDNFWKLNFNLVKEEVNSKPYRWINCIAVIAPKKKTVGTAKA